MVHTRARTIAIAATLATASALAAPALADDGGEPGDHGRGQRRRSNSLHGGIMPQTAEPGDAGRGA